MWYGKRVVTAAVVAAATLAAAAGASGREAGPVTFSKDVAPILNRHCVACHRPDNIAPMSLLTYRDAEPWAAAIREAVTARAMPPWHADPRFGDFANARGLSPEEIEKIAAWVGQGAPEGDRRDLPRAPDFPDRWNIGQPDLVLSMAEEYDLGEGGVDQYVYFRVPTNFKEDRWVQAAEFRPGNLRVVHHAVAYIETPARIAEEQRRGPLPEARSAMWTLLDTAASPLELMDGPTRRIRPDAPVVNDGCTSAHAAAVPTNSTNDILSAYAPGRDADVWPAGTAKRVPAGSNIVFEMHYSKANGATGKDRTSLALVFAKAPVERMVCTRNVRNILFEIPPGAANHEVTACWTFQRDVELISYMPHMHVRGKSMRYEAVFPDGRRETLLSVPNYMFHWQTLYTLRRPIPVPRGTRLVVTGHFDNSAGNHHNPDPSKAVRSGSATTDEMMIGFVNFTVPRPRERVRASVDPKVYDAYVGRYELDPTARLQVVREGERLFFEADGERVELFPSSETTFFVASAESEISFVRGDAGRATEFVVTRDDELVRFRRVGEK